MLLLGDPPNESGLQQAVLWGSPHTEHHEQDDNDTHEWDQGHLYSGTNWTTLAVDFCWGPHVQRAHVSLLHIHPATQEPYTFSTVNSPVELAGILGRLM